MPGKLSIVRALEKVAQDGKAGRSKKVIAIKGQLAEELSELQRINAAMWKVTCIQQQKIEEIFERVRKGRYASGAIDPKPIV